MNDFNISILKTSGIVVKNITNSSGDTNYINLVPIPPSAPVLYINTDSVSYVTLNWDPSTAGSYAVNGYDVYYKINSGSYSLLSSTGGTSITYNSLTPNQTYYYYVVGKDTNSNKSNGSNTVDVYVKTQLAVLNSLTINANTNLLNYNITGSRNSGSYYYTFSLNNITRSNTRYFYVTINQGNAVYSGTCDMLAFNGTGDEFDLTADNGMTVIINGTATLPFTAS